MCKTGYFEYENERYVLKKKFWKILKILNHFFKIVVINIIQNDLPETKNLRPNIY